MEILLETIVKAAREAVYKALTEETGLSAWFTADSAVEGSRVDFGFDGGQRAIIVEVARLEPHQSVEWIMLQGFPTWELTQARITWTLTPYENATMIRFSHSGWETTDGAFASVAYKWAGYIASLKAYVETGRGTPAS